MADGPTVVTKKAPAPTSSSVRHLASQQENAPDPGDLGQQPPSYLPLEVIKARGINIRYDPQMIELDVAPTVDQRPTSKLSFAQEQEIGSDCAAGACFYQRLSQHARHRVLCQPGEHRGYRLRCHNGLHGRRGEVPGRCARRRSVDLCRRPPPPDSGRLPGFRLLPARNAARLRSSRRRHAVPCRRHHAGYTGFQTAPDLLGLSVQRTYAQLQPQKNIHPTGSHSFRIERPSEVDIILDEVLFRHIRLAPGNYDLSELPLRPGAQQRQAGDGGRHRSAADLGVQGLYRGRADRARHQRVVAQCGRQVLRCGRCPASRYAKRRHAAGFHRGQQEFQRQNLSAAAILLQPAVP